MTLSSTVGAKKGGIFGGKGKINDPFFIGPTPGIDFNRLRKKVNLSKQDRVTTIWRQLKSVTM